MQSEKKRGRRKIEGKRLLVTGELNVDLFNLISMVRWVHWHDVRAFIVVVVVDEKRKSNYPYPDMGCVDNDDSVTHTHTPKALLLF